MAQLQEEAAIVIIREDAWFATFGVVVLNAVGAIIGGKDGTRNFNALMDRLKHNAS